jgi:hypothetical protein
VMFRQVRFVSLSHFRTKRSGEYSVYHLTINFLIHLTRSQQNDQCSMLFGLEVTQSFDSTTRNTFNCPFYSLHPQRTSHGLYSVGSRSESDQELVTLNKELLGFPQIFKASSGIVTAQGNNRSVKPPTMPSGFS